VRSKIVSGELSEGHARALLGADPARIDSLAEKVVRGKLSVRATEALVRGAKKNGASAPKTRDKSASLRDLESRLSRALATPVEVRDQGNHGEIAIPYADLDALDRLLDKLLA
jgi:ParB family chromosome partitioning protein